MPLVPPPFIALGAAAVQHALAPSTPAGPLRRAAAVAVGAASVALAASTVQRFRTARTTVHPLHPDHSSALVVDGPNRLTRNPMYVGMAGLLTAHALARGGWATWLPVAGFVGVIDVVQIRPEEEALRRSFGAAYEEYCRSVRRWL